MDGRHAVPLVVSGVLEGVLSDASAGVLSDQFDALDDAVHDLQGEGDLVKIHDFNMWTLFIR